MLPPAPAHPSLPPESAFPHDRRVVSSRDTDTMQPAKVRRVNDENDVDAATPRPRGEQPRRGFTAARKGKGREMEVPMSTPAQPSTKRIEDYSAYKVRGRYGKNSAASKDTGTINAQFEINTTRNGGLDFQYDEVVRGKNDRKRMDAGDCECCHDYYEAVGPLPKRLQAPLWKSPPSTPAKPCPHHPQLSAFGSNSKGYFPAENTNSSGGRKRRQSEITSHKKAISRHRHHWERAKTPPGYWNIGFPDTQETEEINDQAREMHRRKRDEVEAAARTEDGSWTTAAVPAAVLRKVYLTPTRTPATSLSTLVNTSLVKPATVNSFIVYVLSAVAAIGLNVWISHATGSTDQGLAIFVKSKKHPFYLNGRLLFVLLSQLLVATAFSFRNITLDRFVFCWVRNPTRRRFSIGDIVHSIVIAALVSTLVLPFATIIFALLRFALPLVYKLPLLHNFLRPFTAHFLRGPMTLLLPFRHISLLVRTWFIAFTTIATWEFSNATFETFIYNPLSVTGATPEPHVALVSGLSSADLGFRYLAYKDIMQFAAEESESAANQRSALFNDQKFYPNLWSHLVRESLLFLGKDYQHLLRRGKPPPPPPPPAANLKTPAVPVTPARPSVIDTPTPLIRTSIFQSSKRASPIRNVVESLGSDGPLALALDAGAEAAHIPELFRSVEATVLSTPAKVEVKKSAEKVEKVESAADHYTKQAKAEVHRVVVKFAPVWAAQWAAQLNAWWNRERLDKTAQSYLPNVELDVVIVDVLSNLICASLTEDKYGVVQRDIPKTLEAMLSFLSALQVYHDEVRAKYTPPVHDQVYTREQIAEAEAIHAEVDKACDVLNYLSEDLRAGIARIVRTFGDKLLAFKFPPRTAEKLQPFMEYC
ncbi:hypothetical protein C0991_001588 [Blastosporella zonata]|nr:hypothetical protein C0991_001588 [Blastosporella zonata]